MEWISFFITALYMLFPFRRLRPSIQLRRIRQTYQAEPAPLRRAYREDPSYYPPHYPPREPLFSPDGDYVWDSYRRRWIRHRPGGAGDGIWKFLFVVLVIIGLLRLLGYPA